MQQPRPDDRDRASPLVKDSLVGGPVDSGGQPGEHGEVAADELPREPRRQSQPVCRRATGADDRDRPLVRLLQSAGDEEERRAVVEPGAD